MLEGIFGRNPLVSKKLEKFLQQIQSFGRNERRCCWLVWNVTTGSKLLADVLQVNRFDELGAEKLFVVLRCSLSYSRRSEESRDLSLKLELSKTTC